jgi:glucose-6-phosphate isomerase
MLDLILSEPEEFERFYREYGDVGLPGSVQGVPLPREPGKVVFAGMGGSAIVGDFVRSLLLDKAGAAV